MNIKYANGLKATFLLMLALVFSNALHSAELFNESWCKPVGKVGTGTGVWQQSCVLELSFAAARNRVEAYLAQKGFAQIQQSERQRRNESIIVAMWKKDNANCIVTMLRKIDVNHTNLMWGDLCKDFENREKTAPNVDFNSLYEQMRTKGRVDDLGNGKKP